MMALPEMVNMSRFQLGYHGAMDVQAYMREDFPTEMETYWETSLPEPSMREVDNTLAYYAEWNEPEQPWTRFTANSAHHLPSFPVQSYQKMLSRPYEATTPIPRPYEQARGSPTSSSCSSTTSLGMESEWFPESYPQQPMVDDYASSRSASLSQGSPEMCWDGKSLPMASTGLINMKVVQVVPDLEMPGISNPQEVTFNGDDFDMDVDAGSDFPLNTEGRTARMERTQELYHSRSSEEGLELSLKSTDASEPNRSEPAMTEDAEGDVDAEGEEVNDFDENMHEAEEPAEEDEDRDTEYKPKASRGKRRRPSRASSSSSSSSSGKKHKVAKAPSRKSPFQCKTCDYNTKDVAALTRHVTALHTRPYVCTFSFAGCGSTFGNKNEWKRHVSSQHLGLQHWVCSEGPCRPSRPNSFAKDSSHHRVKLLMNVFNRKDLFTQHLKRMHAPVGVKQGKKNSAWDERVKELQSSCLVIKREPPSKTKCPVPSCGQIFEGHTSWDDRMEHVGRHLEKNTVSAPGDAANNDMEQESDEFMIQWALKERIVERHGSGYRFCRQQSMNDADSDAEGEEE